MKTERELFEEWIRSVWLVDATWDESKNTYNESRVHCMWSAWCASAQREGYKLVPVEPTYEMWSELSRHLGRYMQMHDRYCPKTLKKYFDRFIGEPPEWLTKEVGNWESDHAFATADLPVFIYKAMIEAA